MALEAKSRIVPMALVGAFDLLKKGSWAIRPGTVKVRILDPIDAGSYSYEDRDRLIENVRGRIAEALSMGPHEGPAGNP